MPRRPNGYVTQWRWRWSVLNGGKMSHEPSSKTSKTAAGGLLKHLKKLTTHIGCSFPTNLSQQVSASVWETWWLKPDAQGRYRRTLSTKPHGEGQVVLEDN